MSEWNVTATRNKTGVRLHVVGEFNDGADYLQQPTVNKSIIVIPTSPPREASTSGSTDFMCSTPSVMTPVDKQIDVPGEFNQFVLVQIGGYFNRRVKIED